MNYNFGRNTVTVTRAAGSRLPFRDIPVSAYCLDQDNDICLKVADTAVVCFPEGVGPFLVYVENDDGKHYIPVNVTASLTVIPLDEE